MDSGGTGRRQGSVKRLRGRVAAPAAEPAVRDAPMPTSSAAAPRQGSRIDPHAFLWFLVALSALALNAPAEIRATIDHLRVPDTDDAMRLVGVRDLLAGQGWYDNVQYRFLPPAGVASHWSRLVDAPIAGLILALTPLVGRSVAEGLTAALWPMLLFALYAAVLYRGARPVFGRLAAVLAVLVATQTLGLTVQFRAGRVDHHNLQLIAILGFAFCLIRGGGRAGAAGGALAAISLAIGLEGLPYIALGALFLVVDWVLRGRAALPAFLGFGLGLGLLAPVLFGIQTAPGLWGVTACDAISPPWLWLAGGGLALAAACAALDRRLGAVPDRVAIGNGSETSWRALLRRTGVHFGGEHSSGAPARLAVLAALGLPVLAGFALLFPACLGGPFPGMTPLVRAHWLYTVNEMSSLAKFVARGQWEVLVFYPPLLLATLAASFGALRGPGSVLSAGVGAGSAQESTPQQGRGAVPDRDAIGNGSGRRRAFAVAALFLWPGLILGCFQFRGTYVAVGLLPPVAGAVIAWALAEAGRAGLRRSLGPAALAAGLVSTVWLVPAYLADALMPDARGDAAVRGAATCHAHAAVAPLAALPPGTVLAPVFMGPSILLRTPHAVVAAPYHRAIPGLTAAIEGLGGTEADLRRHVESLGIGYLVACPTRPGDDLQPETAFATRLMQGAVAVPWLEPIAVPGTELRVWRVR